MTNAAEISLTHKFDICDTYELHSLLMNGGRRLKKYYQTKTGRQPAREFIHGLDGLARFKVFAQIDRLKEGNPGKGHGVGGVSELVIDFGPGYRVYYAVIHGGMLILLLTAGDKSSQAQDIKAAHMYYADYLERKEKGEEL